MSGHTACRQTKAAAPERSAPSCMNRCTLISFCMQAAKHCECCMSRACLLLVKRLARPPAPAQDGCVATMTDFQAGLIHVQAAKHCQALGAPEVHTVEANLVLPKEVDKARPRTQPGQRPLQRHGMSCQPVVRAAHEGRPASAALTGRRWSEGRASFVLYRAWCHAMHCTAHGVDRRVRLCAKLG